MFCKMIRIGIWAKYARRESFFKIERSLKGFIIIALEPFFHLTTGKKNEYMIRVQHKFLQSTGSYNITSK